MKWTRARTEPPRVRNGICYMRLFSLFAIIFSLSFSSPLVLSLSLAALLRVEDMKFHVYIYRTSARFGVRARTPTTRNCRILHNLEI